MLELALELPAELSSRKRTGKVWVYDLDLRPLAEGRFVLEASQKWQRLHVPLVKTGQAGLAEVWNIWVESWGMKGYAPTNRALPVDATGPSITISFTVQYGADE